MNDRGWESKCSRFYHNHGIPILIDPQVLRSRGLGQIDIATVEQREKEKVVVVRECKNSYRLKKHQIHRLKNAAAWLGELLQASVETRCVVPTKNPAVK